MGDIATEWNAGDRCCAPTAAPRPPPCEVGALNRVFSHRQVWQLGALHFRRQRPLPEKFAWDLTGKNWPTPAAGSPLIPTLRLRFTSLRVHMNVMNYEKINNKTWGVLQGWWPHRDQLLGYSGEKPRNAASVSTHACFYYISWRQAAIAAALTGGLHEDFGQQKPSSVDLAPFRKVASAYLGHSVGLRPSACPLPGFGRLAPGHIHFNSVRYALVHYIGAGGEELYKTGACGVTASGLGISGGDQPKLGQPSVGQLDNIMGCDRLVRASPG